ncbi:MAG: hypothetical protein AB7O38_28730 [Pirellulaceae bacterium]
MRSRMIADPRLGELLSLQRRLLDATRAWSRGERLSDDVAALRREAIRINHQRYVERIPVYGQLAEDVGLLGETDLDEILNELTFTDEVFKSYPPEWLRQGNYQAMTEWLDSIFSHPLTIDGGAIQDLATWRARLLEAGVRLTYSSGTSGRMSFVPRDPLTWQALVRNSQTYTNFTWWENERGERQPFDCLIAGPRGEGMGIQGAGAGLARMAVRTHYLFDQVVAAEDVQSLGHPGTATRTPHADDQPAYSAAHAFLSRAATEQRPVLVFGTPFHVLRLCERLQKFEPAVRAHELSVVATGGGWKTFSDQRIPQQQLRELVYQTLGIPPQRCLDAYSTSELNCTLISCKAARYHVPPLVEAATLDEAGQGTTGREGTGTLAFLDPFAMSYPGFFITGDVAELRQGSCECGRHGWFVAGEFSRPAHREIKGCGGILAATIA